MMSWPPFGQKLRAWRSKPWRNLADGAQCVRCGKRDGTVCSAHYSGVYAQEFGRGKSEKAGDNMTADLCRDCHSHFDGYDEGNDDARALEFMRCIFRTQHRRLAGADGEASF